MEKFPFSISQVNTGQTPHFTLGRARVSRCGEEEGHEALLIRTLQPDGRHRTGTGQCANICVTHLGSEVRMAVCPNSGAGPPVQSSV